MRTVFEDFSVLW